MKGSNFSRRYPQRVSEQCSAGTRPRLRGLLSITEECDKGNLAVFGKGGGALINLRTLEVRHLERVGGTYEAEMWVPSRSMEMEAAGAAGFTRQER